VSAEDLEKLIDLPWQIQVALASGYAAYLLAYAGIRGHHKSIDTAFRSIMFGLFTTFLLYLGAGLKDLVSALLAIAGTLAAALLWRRFGIKALVGTMRAMDVSWADDMPSAWATLQANAEHPITQVNVQVEDGSWLSCSEAHKYVDLPFGPCRYGPSGDIALYVDRIQPAGGEARPQPSVVDANYGALLTYVPAEQVRQVSIRFAPGAVSPAPAAGSLPGR
jgi:hypothetical protein